MPGECPSCEERSRTKDGCPRLSVAPVSAFGGFVASLASAFAKHLCVTLDLASPGKFGSIGRGTHSAHAKGARPDESTTASRDQRYNRHHRNGYHGCHPCWRARSSKAIGAA